MGTFSTLESALAAFASALHGIPLGPMCLMLLGENLVVFACALAGGALLHRLGRRRPVAAPPPPLSTHEVLLAALTVLLNTAVTIAGFILYREGLLRFRTDLGARALLDALLLLLVMDAAMYVLHRLAHHRLVFGWAHALHHRFDAPRPLTLFVLNPLETLGFGALWLVVITVVDWSWLGMALYLALNVVFGTVGHLGVNPVPPRIARLPVLRWIAGSTFHAEHHQFPEHNLGFYTLIWDRLFGTLREGYATERGTPTGTAPPTTGSVVG